MELSPIEKQSPAIITTSNPSAKPKFKLIAAIVLLVLLISTSCLIFWQNYSLNLPNYFSNSVITKISSTTPIFDQEGYYSPYSKDDTHVYYEGKIISNADVNTFVVLSCKATPEGGCDIYYAKDKNHAYISNYDGNQIWSEADPETLQVVYGSILKDKNNVYGLKSDCESCVQKHDPITFVSLGGGYFKDKNVIQYWYWSIPTNSTSTFQALGESGLAKDNEYVWNGLKIIERADPTTFKLIDGYDYWYATDKDHVFIRGKLIHQLNPKTLNIINKNYAKDADTVWLTLQFDPAGEILGADPATFVILPNQGSSAGTFASTGSEYTKDAQHVYFLGSLLEGADPKTFVVLSARYGKDASNVYIMDKVLKNADVATFKASSTNAWVGEDKNHLYDGGKVVK